MFICFPLAVFFLFHPSSTFYAGYLSLSRSLPSLFDDIFEPNIIYYEYVVFSLSVIHNNRRDCIVFLM